MRFRDRSAAPIIRRRNTFALATAAAAVVTLLAGIHDARGDVIYSDAFNRNGNLSGSVTDQGNGTWAASSGSTIFTTTTANGGQATAASGTATQFEYLPVTNWAPNTTYVLTAEIAVTNPSANGFNLALGLGHGGHSGSFHNSDGEVSLDYAAESGNANQASNGSHVVTWNSATSTVGAINNSIFGSPDTFTITVSTPATLATGSWSVVYGDTLGLINPSASDYTFTPVTLANYDTVYVAETSGQSGTIQNFSFSTVTATPEPASLGLFALGALAMLTHRQRRNCRLLPE